MKSGIQTTASESSASTTLACRLVKRAPAALAALVLLSACSAFDQGERLLGPFSGREASKGNESRRSAAEVAADEIAEIASPGSEQQQRLIAEINRVASSQRLRATANRFPHQAARRLPSPKTNALSSTMSKPNCAWYSNSSPIRSICRL